jgi:hypothetical protein
VGFQPSAFWAREGKFEARMITNNFCKCQENSGACGRFAAEDRRSEMEDRQKQKVESGNIEKRKAEGGFWMMDFGLKTMLNFGFWIVGWGEEKPNGEFWMLNGGLKTMLNFG